MGETVLEVSNLDRDFGGVRALQDVSLTFREGILSAIIGPNGAGKSTLFKLVTGLLRPSRGRILFRGDDITGLPPHAIAARGIGQSFQLTNIFPNLTVLDNVELAVQSASRVHYQLVFSRARYTELREKTYHVLRQIRLIDKASRIARTLPYGDQRVLELGLVMAREPSLILLDEPTAGVPHEEIPNIVYLIREIATRRTVILIEHNMEIVFDISQRIVVMSQGQVLADGRPATIKTDPKVERAYFGSSGLRTVPSKA